MWENCYSILVFSFPYSFLSFSFSQRSSFSFNLCCTFLRFSGKVLFEIAMWNLADSFPSPACAFYFIFFASSFDVILPHSSFFSRPFIFLQHSKLYLLSAIREFALHRHTARHTQTHFPSRVRRKYVSCPHQRVIFKYVRDT